MNSVYELCNKYSIEELLGIQYTIMRDPKYKNTKGGIYLYTPEANKLLDNIAIAIRTKMQESK